MPDIATNEPLHARAGLTWEWERDFGTDYPAPTWTLTYYFKNAAQNFSFGAAASGTKHKVTRTPAQTSPLVAGFYDWVAVVNDATNKYEVDKGRLEVLADYQVAGNRDDRTHARKMLEAIKTALEGFAASSPVKSYTIGNRTMTKADIPELLVLKSRYEAEAANEEAAEAIANGLPNPSHIRVRLGRA